MCVWLLMCIHGLFHCLDVLASLVDLYSSSCLVLASLVDLYSSSCLVLVVSCACQS